MPVQPLVLLNVLETMKTFATYTTVIKLLDERISNQMIVERFLF